MKYIVTINNNSYEVEVEQGEARLVKTNETAAVPVVAQAVAAPAAPAAPAAVAAPMPAAAPAVQVSEGEKMVAPMPGTILDIKKKTGDSCKKGEVVLILEAMKMENEIMAPRDCVIGQIVINKGASVNTGDILAVLN